MLENERTCTKDDQIVTFQVKTPGASPDQGRHTLDHIREHIKQLDIHKSMGPDECTHEWRGSMHGPWQAAVGGPV